MMDQERITQYIHSLDRGHGAFCDQIAKAARADRVPIIRKETASFLQAMVAATRPKRILEVGTAVGYSALLMAQVMRRKRISSPLKSTSRASRWHAATLRRRDFLTALPCWRGMPGKS